MRLLFVGDVMLGRLVNEALRHESPVYPWGDTLPLLRGADVRLCNLECALSDRGAPWTATPKMFHFRSDAANAAVLRAARIDAVALANNHALDYGYEALADTLALLDAAAIGHAGAGRTLEEAARPTTIGAPAGRIGLLAFTDNEPAWAATPERPGVLYVPVDRGDPRARDLLGHVRRAREVVDLLVVSAHWGPNWGYDPPPEHAPFARALIDAGADVVFGHSAHVVRGVEAYRGRPILYGAGDYVDDYAVDRVERNDESCVFELETEGAQSRRLRLYPSVIADLQARLARGERAEGIAHSLRDLCAGLGTAAEWDAAAGCLEVALPAGDADCSRPETGAGDGAGPAP
jgi:poly-gamma-glutamate synthesis protein (capsule biosynthesis protein)